MWYMEVLQVKSGEVFKEEVTVPNWMKNAKPITKNTSKEEVLSIANRIIENFNNTLRPSESPRELLKVYKK